MSDPAASSMDTSTALSMSSSYDGASSAPRVHFQENGSSPSSEASTDTSRKRSNIGSRLKNLWNRTKSVQSTTEPSTTPTSTYTSQQRSDDAPRFSYPDYTYPQPPNSSSNSAYPQQYYPQSHQTYSQPSTYNNYAPPPPPQYSQQYSAPSATQVSASYSAPPTSYHPSAYSAASTAPTVPYIVEESLTEDEVSPRLKTNFEVVEETDPSGTKRIIYRMAPATAGEHTMTLKGGETITYTYTPPSGAGQDGHLGIKFLPRGYVPTATTAAPQETTAQPQTWRDINASSHYPAQSQQDAHYPPPQRTESRYDPYWSRDTTPNGTSMAQTTSTPHQNQHTDQWYQQPAAPPRQDQHSRWSSNADTYNTAANSQPHWHPSQTPQSHWQPQPRASTPSHTTSENQTSPTSTNENTSILSFVTRKLNDFTDDECWQGYEDRLGELVHTNNSLRRQISGLSGEESYSRAQELLTTRDEIGIDNQDYSFVKESTRDGFQRHVNTLLNTYHARGHPIRSDVDTCQSVLSQDSIPLTSHTGSGIMDWAIPDRTNPDLWTANDRLRRYVDKMKDTESPWWTQEHEVLPEHLAMASKDATRLVDEDMAREY